MNRSLTSSRLLSTTSKTSSTPISTSAISAALRLRPCDASRSTTGVSSGFHSFSVTLAGPSEQALTQSTVVVEAPDHAPAYVFFTPAGVSDDRVYYTAVFNQPATDEEQR